MFNDDQMDYMRYLATLPAEAKCRCGWYTFGHCFADCTPEDGGYPDSPTNRRRRAQAAQAERAGPPEEAQHGG